MESDWQFIQDHMGGFDKYGIPNFLHSENSYYDEDSYCDENSYYDEDNYCDEDSENLKIRYKVGSIVRLNSSDILMTIKSINNDTFICRWFDKNNVLHSAEFNIKEIILFSTE